MFSIKSYCYCYETNSKLNYAMVKFKGVLYKIVTGQLPIERHLSVIPAIKNNVNSPNSSNLCNYYFKLLN